MLICQKNFFKKKIDSTIINTSLLQAIARDLYYLIDTNKSYNLSQIDVFYQLLSFIYTKCQYIYRSSLAIYESFFHKIWYLIIQQSDYIKSSYHHSMTYFLLDTFLMHLKKHSNQRKVFDMIVDKYLKSFLFIHYQIDVIDIKNKINDILNWSLFHESFIEKYSLVLLGESLTNKDQEQHEEDEQEEEEQDVEKKKKKKKENY